jgi:tRNA(Glu) U13 pseudouridine synthase TruD
MLLARHDTAAGLYGEQFMQRHDISARTRALYTQQQIYGLRRPLWTDIIDPTVRTQSDDILIDFTLPASAYASVIIDRVLEQVQ